MQLHNVTIRVRSQDSETSNMIHELGEHINIVINSVNPLGAEHIFREMHRAAGELGRQRSYLVERVLS